MPPIIADMVPMYITYGMGPRINPRIMSKSPVLVLLIPVCLDASIDFQIHGADPDPWGGGVFCGD
jgi:hypothetical protein